MDWDTAYMEPKEFIELTGVHYSELADICCIDDLANIRKWFTKGTSYREPKDLHKRTIYLAYHNHYKHLTNAR